MQDESLPQSVTLALTPAQVSWLEDAAKVFAIQLGAPVTLHSMMLRLMAKGLPLVEEEMRVLKELQSIPSQSARPKLSLVPRPLD